MGISKKHEKIIGLVMAATLLGVMRVNFRKKVTLLEFFECWRRDLQGEYKKTTVQGCNKRGET